jgi:transposase-like protein
MRMENTPSIAQLQSDWFRFSDLDRASAVLTITQSGISIRKVAAQLHLSESLLRHLLQALQAPACDRDLARQGKMSTNELARRAKAAGLRRSPDNSHALELERVQENHEATDLICDWLLQTQLYGPAREAIVKEVRHKFLGMTQAGLHPSVTAPHDTRVSEIIKRTKPPALTDGRIDIVAWFAQWLCRWAFFAFPDEDIRDNALDLALQKQFGR